MNSLSLIPCHIRISIGLLLLSSLLFCQYSQPVQSISLSRLCGRFGHSCFGANWGKRTLPGNDLMHNEYILLNSNSNEDEADSSAVVDRNRLNNDIIDPMRLELFRHRLRPLVHLK